jgi:hypothetical protein
MKKQNVHVCLTIIAIAILVVVPMIIYSNDDSSADVSPSIGFVDDLKINPHNTNELYAVIARKGLYRSTDKGETWIYCDTGIPISDDDFIREIAFDPVKMVVYARTLNLSKPGSTLNSVLFRSYDFKNWVKLADFKALFDIFIQSTGQSKILYVRTNDGLSVSMDEHTWKEVDEPNPLSHANFYPVAVDRSDSGIVYFAMVRSRNHFYDDGWDGSGIYKSSDQGKNIEKILSTLLDILLISPSDANVMYGADVNYDDKTSVDRILKSTDRGVSWEVRGKLEHITVKKLFMNPADHNILYANAIDYRHLESIDRMAVLNSEDIQAKILLLKSINGGKTWQDISSGSPFNDKNFVRNIVFDSSNPDILYVGAAGGLFKSTDAGKTWKSLNKVIEPMY